VSRRTAAAMLAVLSLILTVSTARIVAQQNANTDEIVRRAKVKVQPIYPDLARRMNITGSVKIQVVVAPNGTVKDAKIIGGHPVLTGAALEAARKWRFEPGPDESSGVIDFKFEPQ
jgi:TonB family protein